MPPQTRQLPKHPRLPDFERAKNLEQLKDELRRWFENEFLPFYRDLYGGITKVVQTETIIIEDLAFGDSETDGSWRLRKVGDDLQVQRRVAGTWVYQGGWKV